MAVYKNTVVDISTHTPHAGRDVLVFSPMNSFQYFYSHAPCGARRGHLYPYQLHCGFLLTRPMRGATKLESEKRFTDVFLLTRPMRGATLFDSESDIMYVISTHTPHAGRD